MNKRPIELYEMDFDFIKSDNFKSLFLLYFVENSDELLKSILSRNNIPQSTYAYAKSKGLATSERVSETLTSYFGLNLEVNEEDFIKLESLMAESLTESYFADGGTKRVREELDKFDIEKLKKTPLWFIYTLTYLSSIAVKNEEEQTNFVNEEVIKFLEFFMSFDIPLDVKYTFYFSYSEFAMFLDLEDLYPMLREKLELYTDKAPDELRTMGEYDLFTLSYLLGKNSKAYYYLLECEKLYLEIYNPKRLLTLNRNIISLAYLDKNYSLVIKRSKSSLLGMSRSNDIKPLMYTASLTTLITALIFERDYLKAISYCDLLLDYNDKDYSNQAYLFKQYIYFKTEDLGNYELIQNLIKTLHKKGDLKDELLTLSKLINDLKESTKKSMKNFGSTLKPISLNTLLGLSRLSHLLKTEYEDYLKKNNKYLDILDMKI